MREIGGYMELEKFSGEEYHKGLHRLNLGRTALVLLLEKLGCRRIYIPYYNCDSVANSVRKAEISVTEYHIDENLKPVFDEGFEPGKDEWVYIINYYGQVSEADIREYRNKYERIIVDNAQAFFERPVDDIPTIYSCRKFLGVSDGAYLAAAFALDEDMPRDISKDRIGYILGRLEENPQGYYRQMLEESAKFADAEPMRMSALTENILRAIDYEEVRLRRVANYRVLKEALSSENPFAKREPLGPFAYPYYHEDGVNLRKYLASEGVFVPTNWSYIIAKSEKDSLEYRWSSNILPLPVDQRYGKKEMLRMAEIIRKYR